MKIASLTRLGVLLATLGMTSAFAQTPQPHDPSGPKTRAQVKAELAEWRAAGYDPLDWINYPANALHAGRVVAARQAQQAGGSVTR
jgi:hypothetical protein